MPLAGVDREQIGLWGCEMILLCRVPDGHSLGMACARAFLFLCVVLLLLVVLVVKFFFICVFAIRWDITAFVGLKRMRNFLL